MPISLLGYLFAHGGRGASHGRDHFPSEVELSTHKIRAGTLPQGGEFLFTRKYADHTVWHAVDFEGIPELSLKFSIQRICTRPVRVSLTDEERLASRGKPAGLPGYEFRFYFNSK